MVECSFKERLSSDGDDVVGRAFYNKNVHGWYTIPPLSVAKCNEYAIAVATEQNA